MSSEQPPSSSHILIADDNHQNCELLEAYLTQEGYNVEMVFDGQQALEAIARRQPDLLLLDIMMPRMSGYEVCRKLKADPETQDMPIVMVTALAEMGDIEKAVQAGADDFLTKPINKLELTTRVKTLLELRHVKSELDRLLKYMDGVDGIHGKESA